MARSDTATVQAMEWGISKSKHSKPFREAFSKLNNLNSLGTVFEMHSATIENIGMLCQLVGRKNSFWSEQLLVPDRPNLTYFLYHGKNAPANILQLPSISKSLEGNDEGITLIYVQSVKEGSEIYISLLNYCEENFLIKHPTREAASLPVSFLHSNLTEDKKKEIMEMALSCKIKILIATSAAGAGINLPVIRFVGWGLDRNPSGLLQSQGRTARKPLECEGVVLWVHNPKLHGHRVPASSKVRELLQTDCVRRTSNSWFSHGRPVPENPNPPEFCCSLCMEACVERSGCQTCQEKLDQFKPKNICVKYPEAEKSLAIFLRSLLLNQVTPDTTPIYSEESLAQEIMRNLRENEDPQPSLEFLSIFSLGDRATEEIVKFLKKLTLDSQVEISFTSESSSDSQSDHSDVDEYFDSDSVDDEEI